MMLESPDETFDELDERLSQQGLEKILELGGFYTKSGQMADGRWQLQILEMPFRGFGRRGCQFCRINVLPNPFMS